MLTPTIHQAPPAYIRRSQRLLAVTKGVEALAQPAAEFQPALTSLQQRYSEWTQARIDARAALVARHEAEDNLDLEIRGVGMLILAAGQGRRRNQAYRRYFPAGYGTVLHRSVTESIATSAGLIEAMSDEANADILGRRDRLTTASTQLEAAAAAHQTAVNARSQAKAALEREKVAWRAALTKFYFAARTVFPDRRSYVESLFQISAGRQPADQPQPPEPAPPGGSGETVSAPQGAGSPVSLPVPQQQDTTVAVHAAAS